MRMYSGSTNCPTAIVLAGPFWSSRVSQTRNLARDLTIGDDKKSPTPPGLYITPTALG